MQVFSYAGKSLRIFGVLVTGILATRLVEELFSTMCITQRTRDTKAAEPSQ